MPISTRWLSRRLGRADPVLDSFHPVKLIVGLGNPGPRYARNRHNVGFMVVDRLAAAERARFDRQRFNAQLAEIQLGPERVLLAKPQTYMNESGRAVGKLKQFYHLAPEAVLVVYDDLDLPLGRLRLRPNGSAGGHHGMDSILNMVGSADLPRLRIGIGRPTPEQDIGHVLGNFRPDEAQDVEDALARAEQALRIWACDGITAAMNRFNAA